MLKEVIELQKNAVHKLLKVLPNKKEITFKAPTGSGKTYMMADFMNNILSKNKDVIFIVSTLSKGNLAKQNYDKFIIYSENGKFTNLKPYLINSEISGEESLHIPTDYNIYLLPRDLYKTGGRLMKWGMEQFLSAITLNNSLGGLDKKIYLIKDECHIKTNNLDNLSQKFFDKILNFSATPNIKRGQIPDVEITDEEAVETKLIKRIEFGDENDSVEEAINKFEKIKVEYRNRLGINPCLIIQISNKDIANDELNNKIFPILNKTEHQDLKWMLIVDKEKECNTNDLLKAKKLPIKKWKNFAKESTSTIDIIIFKMVISEGWDIPRACMLYQVRKTQSEQLDEQVIGRVRRNPRLLDFEFLDEDSKKLALTSWVWGNPPKKWKKVNDVKLCDEPANITNNIKIKTTRIKPLQQRKNFDVGKFICKQKDQYSYNDIFTAYRKLDKADNEIKNLCYEYADDYQKWWKFNDNIDKIIAENRKYICNYDESMELVKDENGKESLSSFQDKSSYTDNGNYENISDWIWERTDGADKFSFDSEAEREWASVLKEISCKTNDSKNIIKSVIAKKDTISEEDNKIAPTRKYLWGKNFITNSNIKFEYYLNGIYASYPDFIMIDNFNRVHIFEVKSVNNSNKFNINSEKYKDKINELKRSYKKASELTGYNFYLPILKDDIWHITYFNQGKESTITKSQFFKNLIRNNSFE